MLNNKYIFSLMLLFQFLMIYYTLQYFIKELLLLAIFKLGLPVATAPTAIAFIGALIIVIQLNKKRLNHKYDSYNS